MPEICTWSSPEITERHETPPPGPRRRHACPPARPAETSAPESAPPRRAAPTRTAPPTAPRPAAPHAARACRGVRVLLPATRRRPARPSRAYPAVASVLPGRQPPPRGTTARDRAAPGLP